MPHKRKEAGSKRRHEKQQERLKEVRPKKNWAAIQDAEERRGRHPLPENVKPVPRAPLPPRPPVPLFRGRPRENVSPRLQSSLPTRRDRSYIGVVQKELTSSPVKIPNLRLLLTEKEDFRGVTLGRHTNTCASAASHVAHKNPTHRNNENFRRLWVAYDTAHWKPAPASGDCGHRITSKMYSRIFSVELLR